MDEFFDVLNHRAALTGGYQTTVAFSRLADIFNIGFAGRPPHAIHFFARITGGDGLFQCSRIHDTPAPEQHIVRAVLTNLQPSGFLLDARCGHWQQRQIKTLNLGTLLQQRNRLFAVGAVVVYQRNFLALHITTLFGCDVLHQNIRTRPIGAHQRKIPFEDAAIAGLGAAVAAGDQSIFVVGRLLSQGKRNAGRQRLENRARCLTFEALIALHATVGGVGGIAFFKSDLHAIDTPIARINEFEVIDKTIGPWHAIGRIRTRAVGQDRKELLFCLRKSCCRHQARDGACCQGNRQSQLTKSHTSLLE